MPWAMLQQGLAQGEFWEVMTWHKSTVTGLWIPGRKGRWWGNRCEKCVVLKYTTGFGGKEALSDDSQGPLQILSGMFWMFEFRKKLETEEEEKIIMWMAIGFLPFINNSVCFNYHVKWRYSHLCTAPEQTLLQTLILPGHALALRKPLFQKQEAPQPREAACSIPLCHY